MFELTARNVDLMRAFNQDRPDYEMLGNVYHENTTLISEEYGIAEGRAATTEWWQSRAEGGVYERTTRRIDEVGVDENEGFVFERSNYINRMADGTYVDDGKYVAIWKLNPEGEWEIFVECSNDQR